MPTDTGGAHGEAIAGLVEGLRRREAWALDAVARHVVPDIRPAVGRLLRDDVEVDDVLQDTLVRIVEQLPSEMDDEGLYPWAQTVANNLARDHLRARRRRRTDSLTVVGPEDEVLVSLEPGPESEAMSRYERAEVAGLLAELPERDREILIARDVDGESVDEVARRFGFTYGAARVALTRIRARARALAPDRELLGVGAVLALWRRVRDLVRTSPAQVGVVAAVVVAAAVGVVAMVGGDAPDADSATSVPEVPAARPGDPALDDPRPDEGAADPGPAASDAATSGTRDPDPAPPTATPGHEHGPADGPAGAEAPPGPDDATATPTPTAETPSVTPSGSGVQVDLEPAGVPVDVVVPLPVPCVEPNLLGVVSTCPEE